MVAIIIDVENQTNIKLVKRGKMLPFQQKDTKFNFQPLDYMVPSSTKNLALKSRILWGQVINQDQTVIKDKLLYKIETLIGLKKKNWGKFMVAVKQQCCFSVQSVLLLAI